MAENNAMNVRIVDGDDCCPQAMCVKVCNLVQEVRKTGASKKLIPSEKAVSDALKGRQELLVAGAAEGILGPSAATGLAQVLTAPSAGVSIVDAIKGRTLKWNQIAPSGNKGGFNNSTDSRPNDVAKIQFLYNGVEFGYFYATEAKTYEGVITVPSGAAANLTVRRNGADVIYTFFSNTVNVGGHKILYRITFNSVDATTIYGYKWDNFQLFDLTKTFESGNEPATAAAFNALYGDIYYSPNEGTLLPFKGTGVKVTGFNQWDEQWELGTINDSGNNADATDRIRSKGYTRVLPSTTYYIKVPNNAVVHFYDINKVWISSSAGILNTTFTTPANAAYIRFRVVASYGDTYNHDICINLSNPALNGTYRPYTETLVNIDAIGKTAKDSGGNAIVPFPAGVNGDGTNNDEYDKLGGTLRWGVREYEAGDESDATVITDGTNTVYPLDADVPFTWDEPFTLAFTAEEGGTIWLQPEGVDAQGVPVSAPLNADIAYTVPAGQVINATTLDNLLDALKTAGVISAYTMTPDGNGNYTFTITA